MERVVWKYTIEGMGGARIEMPDGAKVLSVGQQDGVAMLWAWVDPHAETVERRFVVLGTGHSLGDDAVSAMPFVGTIVGVDGWMVWHVWEYVEADR